MWVRLSLFAALISLSAHASEPVLTSSLGRWLDQSAIPELAETLSKHPMFKGETIRIVALRDGRPTDSSNRLSEAIQERLTRRLLREDGVRIAWTHPTTQCHAPRQINFLLGVEIEDQGASHYQVNIAMVDVEEAVWVSGVNLTWDGRLTSAERRAMREKVSTAAIGSLERPVPVAQADEVARILSSRLSCTHPDGIDGPVFFSLQSNVDLLRVTRGLQRELSVSPIANVTHVEESAEWLMGIETEPMGDSTFELVLMLKDPAPSARSQRAASVFVTGLPQASEPASSPMLVSRLTERGPCRASGRDMRCVELALSVHRPAYLITFHTREGDVGYSHCDDALRPSEPGARRYRLQVPAQMDHSPRPAAGFYVLATESRDLARALHRRLTKASPTCGASHGASDAWLADLERSLRTHPGAVTWRAMHLRNTPTGLAAL